MGGYHGRLVATTQSKAVSAIVSRSRSPAVCVWVAECKLDFGVIGNVQQGGSQDVPFRNGDVSRPGYFTPAQLFRAFDRSRDW